MDFKVWMKGVVRHTGTCTYSVVFDNLFLLDNKSLMKTCLKHSIFY